VDDHVTLVRGGFPERLAPGASVALGGGLEARASVLTVPGTQYARTVRLSLSRPDGAVEDATLASTGVMRLMDHGPVHASGVRTGPGAYEVKLDIYMAGQWTILTDVTTPRGSGRLELEVDIFE